MFVVFGLTQISLFVVFGLTQIPLSLIFLWVVNLTELFGGEVGGFWAHTDPTDLTELH